MAHIDFTYEQLSIMEQIETCFMDKTLTESLRDLMLRGLFTIAEEVFGDEIIIDLKIDGGPRVHNPARYREAQDIANHFYYNELDPIDDEDDDDEED